MSEKTARSPPLRLRLSIKPLVSYVCDFMQHGNIHVLLEHRMHFFLRRLWERVMRVSKTIMPEK